MTVTLATISATTPASALTSGVGLWYVPYSSAQPLNITSENCSSFQCPLVSHYEGFLIQFSPTKSRQPLILRPLAFSGFSKIPSPMQPACQGAEDIVDYSPSPLGPTRWRTWGPSQQIDTVVNVLDLLARGLVSHRFHGRLAHP